MIATSGGECVNVGDKSAILAKALYSFADSFLPLQAIILVRKIKTV
jgi:hypothetical protein